MKKHLTFAVISCTTIALTACGDDVTQVYEQVGVQSFESFDKFPECSKANFGEMAISQKDGKIYYCVDSSWVQMVAESTNGKNGSDGKDGADGEPGKDGKDGKSGENGKDGIDGKDGSDGTNGKDGKDGEPGTSCTANKIKNGVEIVCGGVVVDTLKNGEKGESGVAGTNGTNCSAEKVSDGIKITCDDGFEDVLTNGKEGNPGDEGEPGTSCKPEALPDNSGYTIICGDEPVGVVHNGTDGTKGTGCTLQDNNDGTVTVQCGEGEPTTLSKAICGINPYDPAKQFCDTRDYKIYNYAKIGSQTWMADNLKYRAIYKDENSPSDSGSYCYNDQYNLNPESFYCDNYGRMYTWASAMGKSEEECGYNHDCKVSEFPHQGVCPNGWHLPTKEEVTALLEYVKDNQEFANDNNIAYYLKSTNGWVTNEGNDAYEFNIYPSPYSDQSGATLYLSNMSAYFWTASEDGMLNAFYWSFDFSNQTVDHDNFQNKKAKYTVRCVKD